MSLTLQNVDKLVRDLKDDLKVEKFSDQEVLLDELVSVFVEHDDCADLKDQADELSDLEVEVVNYRDALERIQRILEDVE